MRAVLILLALAAAADDERPASPPRPEPVGPAESANAWPSWSPDGRSIVFASTRDDGDWEIYSMDAGGKHHRRLTHSPGRDAHPAFTRDSKRILFQSPRDPAAPGEVDLYVMNADGSDPRRLVAHPGFTGVRFPPPTAGGSRSREERPKATPSTGSSMSPGRTAAARGR